jgi:hypothetical protein
MEAFDSFLCYLQVSVSFFFLYATAIRGNYCLSAGVCLWPSPVWARSTASYGGRYLVSRSISSGVPRIGTSEGADTR